MCAVGRLVAFQSVAAGDWLGPQLISHMVGHGKQVNLLLPKCPFCLWCKCCVLLQRHWSDVCDTGQGTALYQASKLQNAIECTGVTTSHLVLRLVISAPTTLGGLHLGSLLRLGLKRS